MLDFRFWTLDAKIDKAGFGIWKTYDANQTCKTIYILINSFFRYIQNRISHCTAKMTNPLTKVW